MFCGCQIHSKCPDVSLQANSHSAEHLSISWSGLNIPKETTSLILNPLKIDYRSLCSTSSICWSTALLQYHNLHPMEAAVLSFSWWLHSYISRIWLLSHLLVNKSEKALRVLGLLHKSGNHLSVFAEPEKEDKCYLIAEQVLRGLLLPLSFAQNLT